MTERRIRLGITIHKQRLMLRGVQPTGVHT
jgi:hypothetical protein